MNPLGSIFGKGRQIENLLKKAEEAFGSGDLQTCIDTARELKQKVPVKETVKYESEIIRAGYLEASCQYKKGKIEEALKVIDGVLDKKSGLGDIARLLSEIASKNDDPEILRILEKAAERVPDNNHVLLALCEKYVDSNSFEEAHRPLFTQMYQRMPDDRNVIFGLAMILKNQGVYNRNTLAIFRKAFHEYSTNKDFLYALARNYSTQSPPLSEALPVIERALKFFPDEQIFREAKIAILANLPDLSREHITLLLQAYKKNKDPELANRLVSHLLQIHADDEDACRIYEAVWKTHPKRTTILAFVAERYRLAGRRDAVAMEVFQAFFDDMPRDRENSIYLARLYAKKQEIDKQAILVYQQALKDGSGTDLDEVILSLGHGYLAEGRKDEEAARIYRMAHNVEPDNYAILTALRDVALAGGRMDGSRATALIDFIHHPETSEKDRDNLAKALGKSLAGEDRKDKDACSVYRINVNNKTVSDREEELLADALIEKKETKLSDLPVVERVFRKTGRDEVGYELADLYRQAGRLDEVALPVIIKTLNARPNDRQLAGWAIPHLFNEHGQDENYFPLLSDLIVNGHLSESKGIRSGIVSSTVTRIARDRIREGNFKRAIEILSEAFKYEKNPILQYLLGVSYQGSGDTKTGLEIFRDLSKSDKENPQYKYREAIFKMMSGKLDDAAKDLQSLKAMFSDHPLVCMRMGMLDEARGDYKSAVEEYDKIKSTDKIITAYAQYRKGILNLSEQKWEQGLKLLDKAYSAGVKSKALETGRIVASATLADRAIESKSPESAEKYLKNILEERNPPWPSLINERLFRLGLLDLFGGDGKGSRRALEFAEKTGVRDSRIGAILAFLDLNDGRPKAAMERLEAGLTSRDKVGAELAHRLWCVLSLRLGRHEEAKESADWLVARKAENGVKLRFLAVWRNPLEIDWPPALDEWTYEDLESKMKFPVGLIGRMAYKRADYEGGAHYLEKYYKDEKKPDRVEAEFLLGLMYIKLKKANLGLHYWSHILKEGHRELTGKQRIDGLMLLGFHFLEHGEPEKSREAFNLAKDAGAGDEDIRKAMAYTHLQAGYLAAKVDNMGGAVREWEKILEEYPHHWQSLQNLGLAHFKKGDDNRALYYFNELYSICEHSPDLIPKADFTFVLEETRKVINQLVSLRQTGQTGQNRGDVKREMMLDEIEAANRHYWTLNVKKGATAEEAQANYFRLIKIYNPEKYPKDFMVLEEGYSFFNKPGLLKKNEQKVFNAFHFRLLGLEGTESLSDIPPSPQIIEFLKEELDPRKQIDIDKLMANSMGRPMKLPEPDTSPDFNCPDWLSSW
ncbi:MAG: tetratricopeptide repeat protein [bacterium]